MKGRRQRPTADDVRGLMAELGSLVEDLGLQTPPDTAREPAATPADAAPAAAAPAPAPVAAVPPPAPVAATHVADEVRAAVVDAVPMWEATAEAPPAPMWDSVETSPAPMWEAAEAPPAPRLDALEPQLSDEAPRAWSPSAAMLIIEPAAPPSGARVMTRPIPGLSRRPHVFTLVTAAAVLVAAAVFTFSRLDLGRTTGPSHAGSPTTFQVTGMRTVSATSASAVAGAPTVQHFPSNVPAVYLDITYRNVQPSDALRIVILLQPAQGGATTVSDETHSKLDSGGEIALTVDAPAGGFSPGTYTVRALFDGHLEQTTSFSVDQASP